MLGLTVWLAYGIERGQFGLLLGAYAALFALYVWVAGRLARTEAAQRWLWWTGLALRAAALFSLPNWSDDVYRFLWDGRLIVAGIHPFAHPPAYFMENGVAVPGLTAELYARLNSPHYHTVYPPVCQAVFALAATVAGSSIWGGVVAIKLFLFACEVGSLVLLRGSWPDGRSGGARAVWYALNPLAILEVTGNAHFEGAMIFFLLLGLRALARAALAPAAVAWALAVAAKLLPLLYLPLVCLWLGWRRAMGFLAVLAAAGFVVFLPLLDLTVLRHMAASLDLYFRQFAFNDGVFYLLREAGLWLGAYGFVRALGPLLGGATLAGVLWMGWRWMRPGAAWARLTGFMLAASCLYLFNATTVHPWYVLTPFALSLLTRWKFPLVWTGTVVVSYAHYAREPYAAPYGWIALEYAAVLAWAVWEGRKNC
jgi:hypothetical protein